MAAKTPKTKKGLATALKKAQARLSKITDKAKERRAARKPKVYSQASWKGAVPRRLGVYFIRIMSDAAEVGSFGPYATVRAAAADAKNILRLNIGPGHKIVETGPVVPVIRSDERVKLYLHPESYSAQVAGKGIISAQIIETEDHTERLKPGPDDLGTFGVKYNPRRRTHSSGSTVTFEFPSRAAAHAAVRMFDAAGVQAGMPSLGGAEGYTVKVRASDALLARTVLASANLNPRRRRANPLVSFKTRSGKTISFDAKHRNPAYERGMDESKPAQRNPDGRVPNSRLSVAVLRHLLSQRMGVAGLTRADLVRAAEMTWGPSVSVDTAERAARAVKQAR